MPEKYLEILRSLVDLCARIPNTPMTAQARISALATMNLRYEAIQTNRNLSEHPYILTETFVVDAIRHIQAWSESLYAESVDNGFPTARKGDMEEMHEDLFQKLWTQYDIDQYKQDRIARYERRIDINDIRPLVEGRDCIDFGCGHGNFAHALINRGARRVVGIDYGEGSLRHAETMRDILGVSEDRILFRHATVYDTGEPDGTYDFAIQNGVFHHLDDEDRAYREVYRVLKTGGWFWVYTDGKGAISHHLWDASRAALSNVPPDYIIAQLANLNLSIGKRYHLGDGFNAIYRHTTWEEVTERLGRMGFGNFRRLTGGFPTDFDHDAIVADHYGKEKFGSGDLRFVCQKL
ncbi:class I SAM-dependent methyltransferase (plasmid) [Azospirillum sp. A29]|uniref:class I SAM-dependent methyltransferase n=1 Tax=Azospirillum sp. A29 TaxID=3160606 RepID=UPI00366AB369